MTNRKQKPIPDFETRAAAAQQMAVELRDTQPFNDEYLYRTYEVDRAAIDIDKRTVELAFSSETDKVRRFDGVEILDHGKGSIRLGRLKNRAPLLLEHFRFDHIGVVEKVSVGSDRVARVLVRFGKGAQATEVFNDVVDGIRTKVSVGYRIHKRVLTEEGSDKIPVYRIMDWEPMEISIVSIAADDDVGVGRNAEHVQTISETEDNDMKHLQRLAHDKRLRDEEHGGDGGTRGGASGAASAAAAPAVAAAAATATIEPAQRFDAEGERKVIREAEITRQRDIRDIGARLGMTDLADQYIREDKSLHDFRAAVLEKMGESTPASPSRHVSVDLNAREHSEYSVCRAMEAAADGDWSRAGLEREVNEDIAKQLGRSAKGFFVPTNLRHTPEMMARAAEILKRAPLEAGADASGGYTVQTDVLSLIEMLRNRMMVRRMGATVLSGLQGDLSIPRQATGSAFTWVAETPGVDLGDSDATFDQVPLAPKTGQSSTSYSRQLLRQSTIDVEMFVRNDLTLSAAVGLDLAALHGTGAGNQPTGLINVTGIGDVVGGANGAAPGWGSIVGLETEVSVDNADIGALGYLTNATMRGKLKTTEKAASTAQFVWGDGAASEPGVGSMNGYRAGASNQVRNDLTKGTSNDCSAIFFGNWADLIIGEWGAIEIIVDPYAKKKQGLVEVTSFLMADIAVRRAQSFAAMKDARSV